jgi:hypothetical protein
MAKQTRIQGQVTRLFIVYLQRCKPGKEDGSRRLRLTVAEATVASRIPDHAPGCYEVPLPVGHLYIGHSNTGGAAVDESSIPHVETHVGGFSAHFAGKPENISGSKGIGVQGYRRSHAQLMPTHSGEGDAILAVGILNEP